MARTAAVLCAFLLLPTAAVAATSPKPRLTEAGATRRFLAEDKVADWVGRYPKRSLVTEATYEKSYRDWSIGIWSGAAGEVASGRVDDRSGVVTEAWTGPQVAWAMARGSRLTSPRPTG